MEKEGVLDWAWIFVREARLARMTDDQVRWILDQTLERFDHFDTLTRVSVNAMKLEVKP